MYILASGFTVDMALLAEGTPTSRLASINISLLT